MIIFKGYSIQTSFILQICPGFVDALYKTLIIIKMQQCSVLLQIQVRKNNVRVNYSALVQNANLISIQKCDSAQ